MIAFTSLPVAAMQAWFGSSLEEIPAGQKPVAYTVAGIMLVVAIELVRRRKLREEYALLWLITGLVLLVLAWQHEWLAWFQSLISAKSPVSALFFGAFLFLMLLCLMLSVRLSKLTFKQKGLVQKLAMLEKDLLDLRARVERGP